MTRRTHIDPAELGPRNARTGSRMTSTYANGTSVLHEFDGARWVHVATHSPSAYPKCWTLADGTRQAEHP